jgi:hypothetical protein
MALAEPAGRQFAHGHVGETRLRGGEASEHFPGAVDAAVVDHDEAQLHVLLRQQATHRLLDVHRLSSRTAITTVTSAGGVAGGRAGRDGSLRTAWRSCPATTSQSIVSASRHHNIRISFSPTLLGVEILPAFTDSIPTSALRSSFLHLKPGGAANAPGSRTPLRNPLAEQVSARATFIECPVGQEELPVSCAPLPTTAILRIDWLPTTH